MIEAQYFDHWGLTITSISTRSGRGFVCGGGWHAACTGRGRIGHPRAVKSPAAELHGHLVHHLGRHMTGGITAQVPEHPPAAQPPVDVRAPGHDMEVDMLKPSASAKSAT